ncbi:hypothetical protein QEH56_17175 [Pelagicoccus enzymogenes]|uniref:hypothetical protein n=1 Tax=Pelagicoccus enzymogenes TaxID=2773457 RepID=UPI00280ED621|nr:hypothetical protein [Pelagicoccus enzymogenes]MDQ8199898.1 hypothetical protein [Pelagicoccus enzymogenes]
MNLHQTLIENNAIIQLATAGAGAELISELWKQPGSSAYLAGAHLLQAKTELADYIGFQPTDGFCSKETALDMAMAAYLRAVKTNEREQAGKHPIGIAVTAAVASTRLPRGEQRAHIAIVHEKGVTQRFETWSKETGLHPRLQQDQRITDATLQALKEVLAGTDLPICLDAFDRLRAHPIFLPNGQRKAGLPRKGAFFPANFNPIHEGHRLACLQAEARIGAKVHFMIEACPPNKPAIPVPELLRRVALLQLENDKHARAVMITIGQPNYIDKARAHPGSRFIAGADAVERLLLPIWGYDVNYMLEEMDALDTKFYVLGRRAEGRFVTVEDLNVPTAFRHLFEHLDGFHDASSTQIRKRLANKNT